MDGRPVRLEEPLFEELADRSAGSSPAAYAARCEAHQHQPTPLLPVASQTVPGRLRMTSDDHR